jgi:hypothetical protein
MACPYFCPTQRLEAPGWRGKIRPPLGDLYEGECHARPKEIQQTGGAVLIDGCNFGYAARQCRRFPDVEGPDAVRFCVREDAAGEVRMDYVLERAHLPFEHGGLVYNRALQTWTAAPSGSLAPAASLLRRQAQAYLESYLIWKDGDKSKGTSLTANDKSLAAGGKR